MAYRRKLLRRCRERVAAVTCLQAVCKSFTQRVVATRTAKKRVCAIELIQRILRGVVFRRRARRKRNALRLNKAGHVLRENMQRQTINTLQYQRRETWRELRAREIVNRVMLGCIGRFKAAASDSAPKMNLNLSGSRRWRRCDATPPRRRRCGRQRAYAPRERAAVVSRWRRSHRRLVDCSGREKRPRRASRRSSELN